MNLFNLRRQAAPADERVSAPVNTAQIVRLPRHRQGNWLWDSHGRAYLDFTRGCATNRLRYSPKPQSLINPGSGYDSRSLLQRVSRLCQSTGSEQPYLLNCGADACEGAARLARKWGHGDCHIITATQGPVVHKRSEPGLPGIRTVPFSDLPALHAAVDSNTVAILLQPIQGEAREYLKGVQQLCCELGILLIAAPRLTRH